MPSPNSASASSELHCTVICETASAKRRHGLGDCEPLRLFADAVSQITVQCSSDEAEALFGLGTFDYFQRGTAHVQGGLGSLATGLASAVESLGGEVRFADEVRGLER